MLRAAEVSGVSAPRGRHPLGHPPGAPAECISGPYCLADLGHSKQNWGTGAVARAVPWFFQFLITRPSGGSVGDSRTPSVWSPSPGPASLQASGGEVVRSRGQPWWQSAFPSQGQLATRMPPHYPSPLREPGLCTPTVNLTCELLTQGKEGAPNRPRGTYRKGEPHSRLPGWALLLSQVPRESSVGISATQQVSAPLRTPSSPTSSLYLVWLSLPASFLLFRGPTYLLTSGNYGGAKPAWQGYWVLALLLGAQE